MEKKCRFCPRVCHKQEHLDRHERTHTKVRPYRCDECEKHFVRSDTLKRHQKLHLADAQKPAKQSSRPLKRRRSDTTIESNQSDQSTESSVDQSPEAETVDPQPIFDSLGGGWDYPSLDPLFSTNSFTFPTTADFNNYFNATNLVAEDEEEKEATKLTVSPDSLWEI